MCVCESEILIIIVSMLRLRYKINEMYVVSVNCVCLYHFVIDINFSTSE